MKITQSEIKILIKQCVSDSNIYTLQDFLTYVQKHNKKEVTRNKIYRAVLSLIETKDIVRIERGIYAKDFKSAENNSVQVVAETEEEIKIKKDVFDSLNKINADLENLLKQVNIMDLSNETYDIVIKICELKKMIEDIKSTY